MKADQDFLEELLKRANATAAAGDFNTKSENRQMPPANRRMRAHHRRIIQNGSDMNRLSVRFKRRVARIIDFRMIYVMSRFWFYGKVGISTDPDRRRNQIDGAVKGRVYKIIALPFVFATFWEEILLFITEPFAQCPPLKNGGRTEAGATEWRRFPGISTFLFFALIALWIIQVNALVWIITYHATGGDPFSIIDYCAPYVEQIVNTAAEMIDRIGKEMQK